jgi:hypothetical protein
VLRNVFEVYYFVLVGIFLREFVWVAGNGQGLLAGLE